MSNINNYVKYYLKNQLKGGAEKLDVNLNLGIETDLDLYFPFHGGESKDIWPIISENWKRHKRLGIKSKTNPAINFEFIPNHLGEIDEPILGRGTFTAVYQIKNINDINDQTKYILRLYKRDTKVSKFHMNHSEKIISEYKTYRQYMIKNYYFGQLDFKDIWIWYRNPKDDDYEIKHTARPRHYFFDYVITKVYETPIFDENMYVINISNKQKYKFLYENVIMLDKLQKNNCFHADYKIGNVGWENSAKMNVIAIDYDITTFQSVNKSNPKIVTNENNLVISISFPSTYLPEYLKYEDGIKAIPLNQYIKYSVGGLYKLIEKLNIKYSADLINYDLLQNRQITHIDLRNLGESLNLTNTNYDLIPTYDEIIKVLYSLRKYVL